MDCLQTDAHDDINVMIALGWLGSDSLCGKVWKPGLPERAPQKRRKYESSE